MSGGALGVAADAVDHSFGREAGMRFIYDAVAVRNRAGGYPVVR